MTRIGFNSSPAQNCDKENNSFIDLLKHEIKYSLNFESANVI